jgi:hypothetical protein
MTTFKIPQHVDYMHMHSDTSEVMYGDFDNPLHNHNSLTLSETPTHFRKKNSNIQTKESIECKISSSM